MSLREDAIILAAAGLALYLVARNAGSIGQGAAQAVADAANGIAATVNSAINSAVPPGPTGQSRSLGEWVWDLTHPRQADAMYYGEDINGNIYYPPGALGGGASGSW